MMQRSAVLLLTDRAAAERLARHLIPAHHRRNNRSEDEVKRRQRALLADLEDVVAEGGLGTHAAGTYLMALAGLRAMSCAVTVSYHNFVEHGVRPGAMMFDALVVAAHSTNALKSAVHERKKNNVSMTKDSHMEVLWAVQRLYKGTAATGDQTNRDHLRRLCNDGVAAVLEQGRRSLDDSDYENLCACALTEKAFMQVTQAMRRARVRTTHTLRLKILKGCVHRGDLALARRTHAAVVQATDSSPRQKVVADVRLLSIVMHSGNVREFLDQEETLRAARPPGKEHAVRYDVMMLTCATNFLEREGAVPDAPPRKLTASDMLDRAAANRHSKPVVEVEARVVVKGRRVIVSHAGGAGQGMSRKDVVAAALVRVGRLEQRKDFIGSHRNSARLVKFYHVAGMESERSALARRLEAAEASGNASFVKGHAFDVSEASDVPAAADSSTPFLDAFKKLSAKDA